MSVCLNLVLNFFSKIDRLNLCSVTVTMSFFDLSFDQETNNNVDSTCFVRTEWVGSNFCSTSCGGGKTIERRYCKNGDPHWDCFGNSSRESECNTQSCPTWSPWSSATPCSQTCGEGQIIKER